MKKIQLYYMKFGGKYNTCGYGIIWHLSNTMRLFLKQDIFILYAIEKLQRNSKKKLSDIYSSLLVYIYKGYIFTRKQAYVSMKYNAYHILRYVD